jgi:hypothetical protein
MTLRKNGKLHGSEKRVSGKSCGKDVVVASFTKSRSAYALLSNPPTLALLTWLSTLFAGDKGRTRLRTEVRG